MRRSCSSRSQTYLLGSIAHAVITPIEALDRAAGTPRAALEYNIVPLARWGGATAFLLLAFFQLIDEAIARQRV